MVNSLSDSFAEYMSRRMQRKYFRNGVYPIIANYEEQANLKKGDTVTRPYRSTLVVNTVGSGGSYTRQDITDTEEHFHITTKKEVTFYIEEFDEIQSNYNTRNLYADDAGMALKLYVDGEILGEYDQAASTVDDGDLGGTDGVGFTLTVTNILTVLGKVRKKLDRLNIPENDRWGIISPEFRDVLWQFLAGKESALGDTTGQNGNIGAYGGIKLYVSNGLGWSATLALSTYSTAGDTITINGVVFTAAASPASAGEFDVENSADNQAITIALAVNNTTGYAAGVGSTDTYIEVTAANRALLAGIVATAGTGVVTFKGEGVGYIPVSEVGTATSWTANLQIQHNLFGQGKPIDLVIQKYPKVQDEHRDGYLGRDIISSLLMGLKTFLEGTKQLVDVQILSGGF